MKLYELSKRHVWVKPTEFEMEPVLFDHIDGMYSFCTNKENEVIHLAAWTEVELVEEP
jgi:hypothetical protein